MCYFCKGQVSCCEVLKLLARCEEDILFSCQCCIKREEGIVHSEFAVQCKITGEKKGVQVSKM